MAQRVSSLIAIAYLVFMFVMTHLPKERIPKSLNQAGDKTLHVLAFLGLGLLASIAIQLRLKGLGPNRFGWYAYLFSTLLLGIAYAWFDELTQPLVGRHFDLEDLLADAIGLISGMLLFESLRPFLSKLIQCKELQ
ncbi:MAG: VanZ family protein [Pirellula sp.]